MNTAADRHPLAGEELRRHWPVVAASALALMFGYSTFIGIAFGLLVTGIEAEFGWGRAMIGGGVSVATAVVVAASPAAGWCIDRLGARRLLLPSCAALSISVVAFGWCVNSPVTFYVLVVGIAIAGLGTLPMTYTRILVHWFDRQRGIALGIALSGVAVAAIVLPPALQAVIGVHGWRGACVAFGCAGLLVAWPVAYRWLHDAPGTRYGRDARTSVEPAAPGFTLRGACKVRSFWLLLFAFTLLGAANLGLMSHFAALLSDDGVSPGAVAGVLSLFGVSVLCGRLSCGFLIDRWFAPHVAFAYLMFPAVGLGLLAYYPGGFALPAALLLGLGFGADFDLLSFFLSRYVGLRAYASAFGVIYAAFGVGAAAGAAGMGWVYDQFGSYEPGLWTLGLMTALAALALGTLGTYRWPVAHRT